MTSSEKLFNHRVTLAITGASGTPYALRLLECLIKSNAEISLLISDAAFAVANIELKKPFPTEKLALLNYFSATFHAKKQQIQLFGKTEWTASVASGSSAPTKMVICPTSMSTLSAIASGASNNLIERAADVALKERRQLILVPRETPYSEIHLENMLKLTRMGAVIMPASPGFYQQPKDIKAMIDFIVARILQHLEIDQQLMPLWGEK